MSDCARRTLIDLIGPTELPDLAASPNGTAYDAPRNGLGSCGKTRSRLSRGRGGQIVFFCLFAPDEDEVRHLPRVRERAPSLLTASVFGGVLTRLTAVLTPAILDDPETSSGCKQFEEEVVPLAQAAADNHRIHARPRLSSDEPTLSLAGGVSAKHNLYHRNAQNGKRNPARRTEPVTWPPDAPVLDRRPVTRRDLLERAGQVDLGCIQLDALARRVGIGRRDRRQEGAGVRMAGR